MPTATHDWRSAEPARRPARSSEPAHEVATWRGFKTAAITYTLDDNTGSQLPVAIPLFDQYNFTNTLFTVTSWGRTGRSCARLRPTGTRSPAIP